MSLTATNMSQNALLSAKIAQQTGNNGKNSVQNNGAQNATQAQTAQKTEQSQSLYQYQRQQLNTQILQASAKVSLTSGNQAQALFFQSAVTNISERFDFSGASFNFSATQTQSQIYALSWNTNTDTSAQATSERILNFATGFYDAYKTQNQASNKDESTIAQNFVNEIRTGFEKGYNEAKGILESLQVFNGNIKTDIEKTYTLVQNGLDNFLNQQLNALKV